MPYNIHSIILSENGVHAYWEWPIYLLTMRMGRPNDFWTLEHVKMHREIFGGSEVVEGKESEGDAQAQATPPPPKR